MKSDITDIKNILTTNNTYTFKSVTNPLQTTNIFPTNPWDDTEQVSKLRQQTHVVIKKSPSSQQVTESDLSVLVSTHGIRVDKTRQNKSEILL